MFGHMWDKGYVKIGAGKCIPDTVHSKRESMSLKCMEKSP